MKPLIVTATALGTAGLLFLAGVWLGQQMPWEGQNGFYDLRELPRLIASLAFGFAGLIGGGFLGAALGRRLSEKPQQGLLVASAILVSPVAIYVIRQARIQGDIRRRAALNEVRAIDESAKQVAQQKEWLASPQYAEMIERQITMAERFKSAMGPIAYPGATLVSQPFPRTLVFESQDDFETAVVNLQRLPIEMGRRIDQGKKEQLAYFNLEGFKGSIRAMPTQDGGTSITYTLEG